MTVRTKWAIVRFGITTVTLMLGWLLFTWSLDLGSVLAGLGASVLVALLTYPIFIEETEAGRRSHLPRIHFLLIFLAVLIFNMYLASFQVLWQVIRGRYSPGVVHFRTRLRTDIARVALTSAITLTPGTVSILLDDDHLIVHWLNSRTTHSRYAGKLIKGTYEELLKRVWL
jgi:multicomponent Na+:H+ antiporter subunit E